MQLLELWPEIPLLLFLVLQSDVETVWTGARAGEELVVGAWAALVVVGASGAGSRRVGGVGIRGRGRSW